MKPLKRGSYNTQNVYDVESGQNIQKIWKPDFFLRPKFPFFLVVDGGRYHREKGILFDRKHKSCGHF